MFQNFAKNCMKMKEFGPPEWGARPWRPSLDPPMSNVVTKDTLYLTIDTFLDVVVKKNSVLSVGWYLFRVVSGNRYLLRGSNKKAYCNGNVFVARLVIPLVTKPFLDFVMIH